MLVHRGVTVSAGETILVFHGHDDLRPLVVTPGQVLHCKAGKFQHNDIIGSRYGTRVKGVSNEKDDKSTPMILILQNSADLWTTAVPHRTQIIYATDISVILTNLRVRPGSFVAEAGTGSGSLTHSIARAVAPNGKVFTFDFHKGRALQARDEFQANGVGHLVVSGWRDVCTTGANLKSGDLPEATPWWSEDNTAPTAGFGLPQHYVDALFLDVPAPWLAVENVLHTLKPGGILCTFSPCIEQVQRTLEKLRQDGDFIDIRTVEALTKFFDPVFKRTRQPEVEEESEGTTTTASSGSSATAGTEAEGTSNSSNGKGEEDATRKRPRYVESLHFRAAMASKGHSAYLTFARRRFPVAAEGSAVEQ